jgi:Putative protein-S-isoprenylcysteine methyltransferase
MVRIVLANIFLVCFFLFEFILRHKKSKSLKTEKQDRKSTPFIFICYFIAVAILIALSLLNVGFLGTPAMGIAGLIIMALGLVIRAWSMYVLGSSYSRTLRVEGSQKIVQTGPYKAIRHPGYLGSLLIWVGVGVALENWILLLINAALFLTCYLYRISAEEKMLVSEFGEAYRDYQKKSWRLLPFIF